MNHPKRYAAASVRIRGHGPSAPDKTNAFSLRRSLRARKARHKKGAARPLRYRYGGIIEPADRQFENAIFDRGTSPHGKGPRRALEDERRGRRGHPPAAPPRPSPPDAGRAPSTGQRRPALPRADPAVPSALGGLASGFGMGPGVPRPPWPLTGGRRSSLDVRVPPTLEGSFRVPWGPHSELNGSGIPIDLPELHPPSTCSCARGDATGKSSGD